jgi:hypothetical protein
MIAWMGFKSVVLPYHEEKRMAGKSKYSLAKMVRLASDAIFSFSLMPLYIGLSAGGLFLLLALAQILYVFILADRANTTTLSRLEFADGCHAHRQRNRDDFAWFYRGLCGLYLSGSQAPPQVHPEKISCAWRLRDKILFGRCFFVRRAFPRASRPCADKQAGRCDLVHDYQVAFFYHPRQGDVNQLA